MKSKLFFSVASIIVCSVLFSHSAEATWIAPTGYKPKGPKWSIDLGRSITGIIQGVLTLCGDGDAKAELIAVQEGINENADGSAGWENVNEVSGSTTGTVADTAMQSGVYGYVKSEIMDQTDLSKYAKLQENLQSPQNVGNSQATCESLNWNTDRAKQTCMAVVNTLFADKGDENTQDYLRQIEKQRQEYANIIAERMATLGYTAQEKVISDLQAASMAPVSSDNEVGSIAIDGQTLDEMLKITVADLALQVEMMEADAVAFLLQQPVEIMPEAKSSKQ